MGRTSAHETTEGAVAVSHEGGPRGKKGHSGKRGSSGKPTKRGERTGIPPAAHERIAVAAYYRAERRGFAPGAELDDWLDAEREVEARA